MSDTLISLRNGSKFFGENPILQQIDLQIQAGDFVTLLGPSGSGKTTLLRLLAGLESWSTCKLLTPHYENSAFVFQEPNLLEWRSVLENVLLPLELKSTFTKKHSREIAMNALNSVHLEHASQLYPNELSGGMKMRASIARALVTKPQLLFMDEPFSALDEPTRESLQDHIHQIWENSQTTIVFVTHSIPEAVFLSTRIILLSQKPASIAHDYALPLPRKRSSDFRSEAQYFNEIKSIRNLITSLNPISKSNRESNQHE